jgi:hypothetical protein
MENTEALIEVSREVVLEVNTTMYMVMSRHQNALQNHYLVVCNKFFGNVVKFKYLGPTGTNLLHSRINEEQIKLWEL